MAAVIFWISVFLILYTYVGHPLFLYAVASLFPKTWERGEVGISTAVYVSAFNEEKAIAKKIKNLLEQDFRGNFKIIVADDGSKDRTAEIVRSFDDPKITLYDFSVNRGKAAMQNEIIPSLDCEVVVFTDTTSVWPKATLRKIVQNFKDPDVGCVAVDIMFVNQTNAGVEKGQGIYWKYERFLRKYGALLKTNIVASGTTYAIRKIFFSGAPLDIGEDLSNPLNVAVQGKRVIFDPDIVIEEKSSSSHDSEFKMRTRIATRNVTGLFKYWWVLNPKYGVTTYQLLMHKYLRVLCWIPLSAALVSNVVLFNEQLYAYLLSAQIGFYMFAFSGYLVEKRRKKFNPFYVPYYFTLLNLACTVGFINFSRGIRKATWNPER